MRDLTAFGVTVGIVCGSLIWLLYTGCVQNGLSRSHAVCSLWTAQPSLIEKRSSRLSPHSSSAEEAIRLEEKRAAFSAAETPSAVLASLRFKYRQALSSSYEGLYAFPSIGSGSSGTAVDQKQGRPGLVALVSTVQGAVLLSPETVRACLPLALARSQTTRSNTRPLRAYGYRQLLQLQLLQQQVGGPTLESTSIYSRGEYILESAFDYQGSAAGIDNKSEGLCKLLSEMLSSRRQDLLGDSRSQSSRASGASRSAHSSPRLLIVLTTCNKLHSLTLPTLAGTGFLLPCFCLFRPAWSYLSLYACGVCGLGVCVSIPLSISLQRSSSQFLLLIAVTPFSPFSHRISTLKSTQWRSKQS
jgi:hypothetical protein